MLWEGLKPQTRKSSGTKTGLLLLISLVHVVFSLSTATHLLFAFLITFLFHEFEKDTAFPLLLDLQFLKVLESD